MYRAGVILIDEINVCGAVGEILHEFWSGFGVPAFVETCVPRGMRMPYITYTFSINNTFETSRESAKIWTYAPDTKLLDRLTQDVMNELPPEGLLVSLPGALGAVRLGRSGEFVSTLKTDDPAIKARSICYTITNY